MQLFCVSLVVCILPLICYVKAERKLEHNSAQPGPLHTRVINGQNARIHEWPWQISLRRNGRHICGGSLIRHDWVLTAAHCVQPSPNRALYTVIVGAHRRRGSTAFSRTFRVRRLFYHAMYLRSNSRYDVALLQLDGSVRVSRQVRSIQLPTQGDRIAVGSFCFITGWGRTRNGGPLSSILQKAPMRIAGFRHCLSLNTNRVHNKTMICAGAQGKGGCHGDSGGPLSCFERGRWMLRGVTSWGFRNCRTDRFSVFSRVSSMMNWINRITRGGSQTTTQRPRQTTTPRPRQTTRPRPRPTNPRNENILRILIQMIEAFKTLLDSIKKFLKLGLSRRGASIYKRQITSMLSTVESHAEDIGDSQDPLALKAKQDVKDMRMRAHVMLTKLDQMSDDE